MFYDTALCNHVLMNGYFSISNSYTLRNVYVPLTTNPSMFYDTTLNNHSLEQHNHVLMNGYVPISYCYTLCYVYVRSTTNPGMLYDTTVKNHSLDQHSLLCHVENTQISKKMCTTNPGMFYNRAVSNNEKSIACFSHGKPLTSIDSIKRLIHCIWYPYKNTLIIIQMTT